MHGRWSEYPFWQMFLKFPLFSVIWILLKKVQRSFTIYSMLIVPKTELQFWSLLFINWATCMAWNRIRNLARTVGNNTNLASPIRTSCLIQNILELTVIIYLSSLKQHYFLKYWKFYQLDTLLSYRQKTIRIMTMIFKRILKLAPLCTN